MQAQTTWMDLLSMEAPIAELVLPYGPEPYQFGELRFPEGDGPFPLVMMVHGGCSPSESDAIFLSHLAEALKFRGFATWNIEYRGVNSEDGGWTGTFDDVLAAIDAIPNLSSVYPVDSTDVVLVGHGIGGLLSLWSAVYQPRVKSVVGLGAFSDLSAMAWGEGECTSAVLRLMGGLPDEFPDRYAYADPILLPTTSAEILLISGEFDDMAPVDYQSVYVETHGAEHLVLPELGHYDLIDPQSPSWNRIIEAVVRFASKRRG